MIARRNFMVWTFSCAEGKKRFAVPSAVTSKLKVMITKKHAGLKPGNHLTPVCLRVICWGCHGIGIHNLILSYPYIKKEDGEVIVNKIQLYDWKHAELWEGFQ